MFGRGKQGVGRYGVIKIISAITNLGMEYSGTPAFVGGREGMLTDWTQKKLDDVVNK